MHTLVTILHVVISIALILVVLLQAGKGASMGAAFGGSSQTVFGSSGAGTFLGKMTAAIAIIFMLTSLTLTYTSSRRPSSSLMEKVKAPAAAEQTIPAEAKPAQSEAAKPLVPAPVKK
ncbi:MAG TPA: preprotein translocase subunit SecG [Smithellaceae bacterium]|nr:preprotein translocase subunit SecG [Smithellaceae bacterium]